MDALGRKDMGPDRLDQRHQRCRTGPHPVGERRDVEIDAFARVDVALAMERQMQAILGKQQMGEQPWPPTPTRDRVRGRRRLRDLLARPARELLAHVLDHLPLARDELQRLGHILAELVQNAAAAWTGARPRIDDALARQMLGQRPARRLAPMESLNLDLLARRRLRRHLRRSFGFGGVLLHVGEPQLQLLEHRTPLRGLSEPLVPQLGDRELHLLDQQRPGTCLGLEIACLRLCRQACRLRGNQHRLQALDIIRERIICAHIKMESQDVALV